MKIATAEQMRHLDNVTIHDRGVDSTLLMERAPRVFWRPAWSAWTPPRGKRCACILRPRQQRRRQVAVARLLLRQGLEVRAFLVGKREKMTPDCREMERRLQEIGGALEDFQPGGSGPAVLPGSAHLCVDAIFGIGLNSDIGAMP